MTSTTLRRVDPTERAAPARRAYVAFLGTRVGRWTAINIAPKADPWLLTISGGRVGMALILPSTLLTTRGAKTGRARSNAVLYFNDGADVIVIASSYGRESNPSWYYNLTTHPAVTVGDGQSMTATEVAEESERIRLWSLADRIYPLFADYRVRAAASGRTIPIIRLSENA
ncbi:nitroreductase [Mycobacteroides stephanolepidis]|uniref:Nitroreductase n=1 Tax=[Mycobacterium] stephanolepidis TaxID=1520670 RepID=A0A1Z4ES99_9MYCO|nr:nitroreductase/quinone reductase family protein [[Mycobacterium] stephanolepidis]BAX95837.1 nitroreductase [[Mycobacterium] stephanolepidis]